MSDLATDLVTRTAAFRALAHNRSRTGMSDISAYKYAYFDFEKEENPYERLARAMETATVEAAFDPAAPTGVGGRVR